MPNKIRTLVWGEFRHEKKNPKVAEIYPDGMHEAIAADRRAGNIASRSQFASVAIRSAIEDSRDRAGGELPPAPARLPNKLR